MIGRSREFDDAAIGPVDNTECTAVLLEGLAAEVRRHGVVDGQLTRARVDSRVQTVTLELTIDRDRHAA